MRVRAPVYPSEDPRKVLAAISSVFGEVDPAGLTSTSNFLQAVYRGAPSLEKVYEQARSRGTLGVLRRLLRQRARERATSFLINKQVATRGVVVLCEGEGESPLGAITVTLEAPEIEMVVDWLAPRMERPGRSLRKRQV